MENNDNMTDRYLPDTLAIKEFMETFRHPVRDEPIKNPTPYERELRARLVLEEAFELAQALGVRVALDENTEPVHVNPKKVIFAVDEAVEYDMVEAADACADLIVVSKGTGLQLGLPVDEILLDQVQPSNMSKLGENKEPIFDAGGKIQKGPNYFAPDVPAVLGKYLD